MTAHPPPKRGGVPEFTIINTVAIDIRIAVAQQGDVTNDALSVDLVDGRTVSVPLAWYPRLLHATPAERKNWRLVGKGEGIHWPDLDEDISIENIVLGQPSGESPSSFKQWLEKRRARSGSH